MPALHVRTRTRLFVVSSVTDKHASSSTAVRPVVKQQSKSAAPPTPKAQQLVDSFSQHWLPKLLQQQEHILDVYNKVEMFGEKLTSSVTAYQGKLVSVVENVLAPVQLTLQQQELLPPGLLQPPKLDLTLLDSPANGNSNGNATLTRNGRVSPDAELSALASDIQTTNMELRGLERLYNEANSSIVKLQDGADERDHQQQQVCEMLLEYADDLERQEAEAAAARAAWEIEQARIKKEVAAWQEEQALLAEEEAEFKRQKAQREAEEAEAAAAAAKEAELNKPLVKVELGVHLATKPGQDVVLVGSHPCMGSWSIDDALPLTWTDGHVWKTCLELPADCSELEYKAVLRSPSAFTWERGDNHKAVLQGSSDISLYHVFRH